MENIKIYHNPRCSKSRIAKSFLEEKGLSFDIIEYLKEPLTVPNLTEIIAQLNMKPQELLRKNEAIYKEKFKGKTLSDKEWIEAMVEFPKLMERPIVVNGEKAVVARPAELISDIL